MRLENASGRTVSSPPPSVPPRRFRSRLATIRDPGGFNHAKSNVDLTVVAAWLFRRLHPNRSLHGRVGHAAIRSGDWRCERRLDGGRYWYM